MKLPNLQKALELKYGDIGNWSTQVNEFGFGGFTIKDPPYNPYVVEFRPFIGRSGELWTCFYTEVNGDDEMDPGINYGVSLADDGTLDFFPLKWVSWPFGEWPVIDGPSDMHAKKMGREEVEAFAREFDIEFARRGWIEKAAQEERGAEEQRAHDAKDRQGKVVELRPKTLEKGGKTK